MSEESTQLITIESIERDLITAVQTLLEPLEAFGTIRDISMPGEFSNDMAVTIVASPEVASVIDDYAEADYRKERHVKVSRRSIDGASIHITITIHEDDDKVLLAASDEAAPDTEPRHLEAPVPPVEFRTMGEIVDALVTKQADHMEKASS